MIYNSPDFQNLTGETTLTVGSDYSSGCDEYIVVEVNGESVLEFYNNEMAMYTVKVKTGDRIDAYAPSGNQMISVSDYSGLSDVSVNGDSISGTAEMNPYILFT